MNAHSLWMVFMSSNKGRSLTFRYATLFIDDDCNLNDAGQFGRSFSEIYSNILEVKCEYKGTHTLDKQWPTRGRFG